ncbi:MAG: DNA/RNA non-specific endonuclease [Bacteroidia bacterium]
MKKLLIVVGVILIGIAFWYFINKKQGQVGQAEEKNELELAENENIKEDTSINTKPIKEELVLTEDLVIPKVEDNDLIIKRIAYTLSFNEEHEQAEWVAYTLSKSEVMGDAKRKDNFKADGDINSGSASLGDYKRSGYDRGHLAPAADMSKSQRIMDESFYMSNMSPQTPSFNRGIWKKLEEQVRDWTLEDTLLYVVTGPVLRDGLPTIGDNEVSVPEYYYKVIADFSEPELKCIAFLMPNEKSKESIYNYVVSIDSLEKVTGLDFYPMLPDPIENSLEQSTSWVEWE